MAVPLGRHLILARQVALPPASVSMLVGQQEAAGPLQGLAAAVCVPQRSQSRTPAISDLSNACKHLQSSASLQSRL